MINLTLIVPRLRRIREILPLCFLLLVATGASQPPSSGKPKSAKKTQPSPKSKKPKLTFEERQFKNAVELLEAGDYLRGRNVLKGLVLLKKSPKIALYWFNLGNVYNELGDYANAVKAYQWVIRLASPLSPAALLYQARANRSLRRYLPSLVALEQLSQSPITLPPALGEEFRAEREELGQELLSKGLEAFKKENHEAALRWASLSIRARPRSDVYMLRALSNWQLEQYAEAKADFEKAQQDPDQRSPLAKEATAFVEKLSGEGFRYDSSQASLEFGLGYNSNVSTSGESELELESTGDKRAATELYLGYGAKGFYGPNLLLRANYELAWEEVVGLTSYRFIRNRLQLPLRWALGGAYFQVGPKIQHEMLGAKSFALRFGTSLQYQRSYPRFKLGWAYDFGRNLSQDVEYRYLSGAAHDLQLYVNYETPRWAAGLSLLTTRELSGDLPLNPGSVPLSYWGFTPSIFYAATIGPLWEVEARLSHGWRFYDGVTDPLSEKRRERQFSVRARGQYRFAPRLKIYISAELVKNGSTLGAESVVDKNFSQFVSLTGVMWDLLP